LGVATFDALDASGAIYSTANSYGFIADYLTSQAIRLDSLPVESRSLYVSDSVYLSFYYQPQGSANAPETADSLVLEFYSGSTQLWYHVWSSPGMTLDSFYTANQTYCKQVLIPITDSARFFRPDFKFRFYNYASLATSAEASWQSNADEWNIDYVKLDAGRNRNDIYSEALVFVNQPPTFLKNYRAMPYEQYKNDPTNSMNYSLHSVLISNLSANAYTAEYGYHISGQIYQDSVYNGGAANINPFVFNGYSDFPRFKDPPIVSFFSLHNDAEKTYTITHTVGSILGTPVVGDTVVQEQYFGNYFAYDDGTSEAGYGLSVSGGSAALRYKMNTPDTLTQVQVYFNPVLTGNSDYFYLTVWESIDPEVVLYEKLVQASTADIEQGFATYDLDELVVVSNDFYVGFTQISNNNLNVGFDLSYAPQERLFYNVGDGWYSSIYSGALMIRPVFATVNPALIPLNPTVADELRVYPNPLQSGTLTVEIAEGENYRIQLYNLLGKLVYSTAYSQQLNLDFLSEGVYIIRFENQTDGSIKSEKLIISRGE